MGPSREPVESWWATSAPARSHCKSGGVQREERIVKQSLIAVATCFSLGSWLAVAGCASNPPEQAQIEDRLTVGTVQREITAVGQQLLKKEWEKVKSAS